jgi:molybdopterin-guanine dinucleotide biosynthesis protein A
MAAIILAGGKSSRMGADKALLPWREGTLLDNAVELLIEFDDQPIIVVDQPKNVAAGEPIMVIDKYPGAGPLGGLVTGLSEVGTGFHLVRACDLPLLEPELLKQFGMWAAMNSNADAIIPVVDDRDQVLCAMYHSRALPAVKQSLEAGERAIHRAIQNLNCVRIPESLLRHIDPDLISFRNINTREEYEQLWREYGQA